jgi:hypothetical protein
MERKRQRHRDRNTSKMTTSSTKLSSSSFASNDDIGRSFIPHRPLLEYAALTRIMVMLLTRSVVLVISQDKSFHESDWWVNSSHSEDDESTCQSCTKHSLPSKNPVSFRNCGLELWNTSRIAWRQSLLVDSTTTTRSQPLNRCDREQVQVLLRTRTGPHPLPQVIALSEMVQMYSFMWYEDDSDA